MAGQKEESGISLGDRLEHGNLTVEETRTLKNCSHSGFYEDLQGRIGRGPKDRTEDVVPGPIAAAYIAGRPLPEVA